MKKHMLIAGLLAATLHSYAQDSTKNGTLTISGYAEAYYSHNFARPANHQAPGFLYSYNKHNELNLNMAMVKASYSSDRVHANVGLLTGTYAQYNLAAEPSVFQYVYEANAGVRVGQVWIDAGIMPSHIGFESAIGKDCYTLTRSIMAENTPYYEAGVKATWAPNDKWSFAAMYLNGWQRIRKVDGNQTPSFGAQVVFKPTAKILLNWSTYVGSDSPDSTRKMRYFNDLYGTFGITDKFSVIAGCDYGLQQKEKGSGDYASWISPIVVARYAFTPKFALAGRAEYYADKDGVIIATGTPNGFKTTGFSLNADFTPVNNVMFRIEGRMFNGKDKTFLKQDTPTNTNGAITASLAVWF